MSLADLLLLWTACLLGIVACVGWWDAQRRAGVAKVEIVPNPDPRPGADEWYYRILTDRGPLAATDEAFAVMHARGQRISKRHEK